MIRVLGGILVAVSCGGLGMLQGKKLKNRILQLKMMIRIAAFLEGEISFAKSTLPEALKEIGGRTPPPFSGFLEAVSRRLGEYPGEGFSHILKQEMEQYLGQTELTGEDLEEFYRAASDLGYLDKKMQVHILASYRRDQEEKVQRLAGELPQKQKLFSSLGILGGIFLVILFF